MDPRLRPLADALREELADRRLKQAEVERRLGWSKRYLSKILNGRVTLSFAHLFDVLEAAGVEPDRFWCRLCLSGPESRDLRRRVDEIEALVRRGRS